MNTATTFLQVPTKQNEIKRVITPEMIDEAFLDMPKDGLDVIFYSFIGQDENEPYIELKVKSFNAPQFAIEYLNAEEDKEPYGSFFLEGYNHYCNGILFEDFELDSDEMKRFVCMAINGALKENEIYNIKHSIIEY